tara:strand:+ start:889 stop:1761 length:873 start_codon:yes stop_codon:yes gene_type:complete
MGKVGLTASYFNPCGFKLRKDNYLKFYEELGDKSEHLVTVELAFDDAPFHLEHLPNRLSYRSDHILWHKEALLNLGVQKLIESGYEYIVWLDADIMFHNEDWYEQLELACAQHNLIQVFETIKRHDDSDAFTVMKGTAASIGNSSPATGFGWGSKASILRDCKLYSNLIIGGGDTLIYAAGAGYLKEWLHKRRYSLAHIEDIVSWSNLWYGHIQGDVGFAKNRIDTFYHGDLTNRNYLNRHELLLHNEFDPKFDIAFREDLVLKWANDKTEMHAKLRSYFADRQEDGVDE